MSIIKRATLLGETLKASHSNVFMGYLNQIDPWLEDQLRLVASSENVDAVIADVKRQIKGKILESYRNGQGGREKRASGEASGQGKYTKKYTKPRR